MEIAKQEQTQRMIPAPGVEVFFPSKLGDIIWHGKVVAVEDNSLVFGELEFSQDRGKTWIPFDVFTHSQWIRDNFPADLHYYPDLQSAIKK